MKNTFRLETDSDLDPAQVELFLKHSLGVFCQVERADGEKLTFPDLSSVGSTETEFIKEELDSYKAVTEQSSDIITFVDENGNYLYVNPAFCVQSGYTRDEALQMNVADFDTRLTREKIKRLITSLADGESKTLEAGFQRKNGEMVATEVVVTRFTVNGKVRLASNIRDITERKRAENFIVDSERHFREITDTAPVLIWISDINRLCTHFNKTWLEFTGRTLAEELGEGWKKNVHLEDVEKAVSISQTAFERRVGFEMEYRLRRHDGEYRWVLDKGEPRYTSDGQFIGYIGICVDVSEFKNIEKNLRESEAQLRQSQKMEAVGKLSGGIAHDFNNLLSVIMLHVDMLKLQLGPESPFLFRVDEIKSAAKRAASLTRQLLALSRRQMLQPRLVSLNLVVIEMGKMLERLIGEDIELKLDLAPDLDLVMIDPEQMSQVLMNLALNSRDAMPSGGKLNIETVNIRLDTDSPMSSAQPFGNYVQLTISDSGGGMPPEVLERIFDPFFTTKESGKGTGLGLSTVYGIIKQSCGYVSVNSEVGVGTSFVIQLPQGASRGEGVGLEERDRTMIIGTETILLVEDEEMIRNAAHEVLIVLGYTVLQAKDGVEALEILRNYDEQIDLLLTDVVMPRMNGGELAKNFQILRPNTPILFMSGYTDDVVVRYGVLRDGAPFIEKPFTPSSLGYKIREILDPKQSQT